MHLETVCVCVRHQWEMSENETVGHQMRSNVVSHFPACPDVQQQLGNLAENFHISDKIRQKKSISIGCQESMRDMREKNGFNRFIALFQFINYNYHCDSS